MRKTAFYHHAFVWTASASRKVLGLVSSKRFYRDRLIAGSQEKKLGYYITWHLHPLPDARFFYSRVLHLKAEVLFIALSPDKA